MALPTLVCLKSVYNNKYLRYRYEDVQTHGLLQFAGETVMDPYAQFEVEKAKTWDGLVHLKSRYTNKYLVRWSPSHYWITASAHAAEENQFSWSCTLFKPVVVEESSDTKKIRLLHVQLGHYASLPNTEVPTPFVSCLIAASKDPDGENLLDVVSAVDWESVFRLPNRVAFKGDNGLYLGAKTFNKDNPGLQFSFQDPEDPKVVQQIFQAPDGTIYIKSEYYGKFWRLGGNDWIVADAEDPRSTENVDAMFRQTVLGTNIVALLNMKTTAFVKRYTAVGMESFLRAATIDIDGWSRLEIIDVDK